MTAEDLPTCTICGVPVRDVHRQLLHYEDGRLDRFRREPRPHDATLKPPEQ